LRAFAPLRLCEKQKTCIKVRPEIFSQSRKGAKARKEEEAVAVDNGLESTKSQLQIFYKSIINIQILKTNQLLGTRLENCLLNIDY